MLCAISAAGLLTLAGLCHVACARPKAQHITCLNHVEQVGLGLLMYAVDYDGFLPPGPRWSEAVEPNTKMTDILHCPVVRQGASYGLNAAVAGLPTEEVDAPAPTVMLFEADTRNPSFTGGPRDVSARRHMGGSHIVFVEGSAKRVQADGVSGLVWEPQPADGAGGAP